LVHWYFLHHHSPFVAKRNKLFSISFIIHWKMKLQKLHSKIKI
jgi:hypothetical protein